MKSTLGFNGIERVLPEPMLLVDGAGVVVTANPAACQLFDRTFDQLCGSEVVELTKTSAEQVRNYIRSCSGSPQLVVTSWTITNGDLDRKFRCEGAVVRPSTDGESAVIMLRLRPRELVRSNFQILNAKIDELALEVNARRRTESILEGQRQILELIATSVPLDHTLAEVVRVTERLSPGKLIASVMLVAGDGRRLLDAAGDRLPSAYREAINGVSIGPNTGSCGTAAYHNRPVIVSDIASDPLWRDYKDLAAEHGLAACWSTPIPSRGGDVLGTLALYYHEPRLPEPEALRLVEIMTRMASVAIERSNVEQHVQQLLESEQMARSEAETANLAKDEFLAMVSHELRNPLNAITGWIQVLKSDGIDDTTRKKGIETIARNAEHQAQLIGDVLDFARVKSGQFETDVRPFDLSSVVIKSCESIRPQAAARHISLEFPADLPEMVAIADPDRLDQAFTNILWNAIKFTPEHGRVTVEVEESEGIASFTIRDTGCGIDPAFLPYIFDRFQQADSSRTREHGGLGLGLAIVKHIVDLHNGSVEAHSDGIGSGSTFTISIPLARAEIALVGGDPVTESRLDGLHVLAVDDAADVRELAEVALARSGARVTTAESAVHAFDAIRRERPDLIVCDISMPGMDGYDFIRQLRLNETGARLPALALTAHAREADRREALAAGFDQFLPKPVAPAVLVAKLAELAAGIKG